MSGPAGYAFQPRWNAEELENRRRIEEEEVEEDPIVPQPAADRVGRNDWCRCGNCPVMPTARESICCREIGPACDLQEDGCIIQNPDFISTCLTPVVARVFSVARRDIRGHRARVRGQAPPALNNKSYRYASYRLFTYLIHGFLGRGVRKVIPACVVNRIHLQYPEASGVYIGFKLGEDDEEVEVPEHFAI
nr:uncharacterized protein LOC129283033 [Lytechinus pictus]